MERLTGKSLRALYQRMIRVQNTLGQIKTTTEMKREPASILREIGDVLRRVPLPPVEIAVESIKPEPAWPSDFVQVEVTITNTTKEETSGLVTADVLQDGFNPVLSSGFGAGMNGALAVTALGSGQKVLGTVTLKLWSATPTFLKVGPQDLHLQYWIVVEDQDPRATISLFNPFTKTAVNLAPIADAWNSLELYPHCQQNLPEFAAQADFLKIKYFQFNGSNTIYTDDYDALTQPLQSVTLSWDVASGGFPPSGEHPGSLSSVILTGPNLGNGIALAPSGQQKFAMGEIDRAEAAKPFVLTATGNCGKVQASLNVQLASRPPVIEFFNASPNDNDPTLGYVYLGMPATLTWQFSGLAYKNGVSIVGKYATGDIVFKANDIVAYNTPNSIQVIPSDNTSYVLQINGPGGSATASLSVDVYNSQPPEGTLLFFKMTDSNSDVLPCFMVAIYAPDAHSGKALLEAKNGGYTATRVDESEFLAGCS